MAVIIKYVVERNGVEKMTFTSKKEADAYDKLLDLADALEGVIEQSAVGLEASQREELALYLANHKDQLQQLLKGGKPKASAPKANRAEDIADAPAAQAA